MKKHKWSPLTLFGFFLFDVALICWLLYFIILAISKIGGLFL